MSATAAITREECKARLAAIAGAERIATAGETVTVAASDAEQIAEILRFANGNGIAVTPSGSGTKQSLGQCGRSGDSAGPEPHEQTARTSHGRT